MHLQLAERRNFAHDATCQNAVCQNAACQNAACQNAAYQNWGGRSSGAGWAGGRARFARGGWLGVCGVTMPLESVASCDAANATSNSSSDMANATLESAASRDAANATSN